MHTLRFRFAILLLLPAVLFVSGCSVFSQPLPKRKESTIASVGTGAILGGAVGAIIGAAVGSPGAGAAVGAGLGGLMGDGSVERHRAEARRVALEARRQQAQQRHEMALDRHQWEKERHEMEMKYLEHAPGRLHNREILP